MAAQDKPRRFWQPNLDTRGRLARGGVGLLLLLAGLGLFGAQLLLPGVAVSSIAGFVLVEALRGWCVLRACGIKTRL